MNRTSRCPECGGEMHSGTTTYCDMATSDPLIVENVPALICAMCGAEVFSGPIVDVLQALSRERPTPSRVAAVPVYALYDGRYDMPADPDHAAKPR